jgi:trehalose 6-phosphate synthase/phosphatase
MEASGRKLIVSNRMPISFRMKEDGSGHELVRSPGGLVTALQPVHTQDHSLWIGVAGQVDLKDPSILDQLAQNAFCPVDVPDDLYALYYNDLSNGALWPLFHYFPTYAKFSLDAWEGYRKVNQIFCDRICEIVEPEDIVWIHDYQLMLLPEMLRQARPDLQIGYFHHIPFPASEVLRIFPWRTEVLNGLLGADLVGFHTLEYARHFVSAASRLLGLDSRGEDVLCGDRLVKVGAFPLGIDPDVVDRASREPAHLQKYEELQRTFAGKKLILGVDRLDYTKGIRERLVAFQQFLAKHPEYRETTVLLQLCVPSRVEVLPYEDLRDEVEWLVGRINGQFGTATHTPVQYLFQSASFAELTALYRFADVCLVTPLRDGLNLVCKEYIAAKKDSDGVLILSEFAGAAEEMGEAVLVNPFNPNSMVSALERALRMTSFEKAERMQAMKRRVFDFNNSQWVRSYFELLQEAVEKNHDAKRSELVSFELDRVLERVRGADRVWLCLDLDASLIGFRDGRAHYLEPDDGIFPLLNEAAGRTSSRVVLLSRQSVPSLERRFGSAPAWVLAENGALMRDPAGTEWSESLTDVSLETVRAEVGRVLERCVRRVPRSSLEFMRYGIVWEFERSTSIFAHNLALQTFYSLNEMLANTAFQCVLGRRHLEIRPVVSTKLRGLSELCRRNGIGEQDLLVTIGDSKVDEDIFRAFSGQNVPINLGIMRSKGQLMVRGTLQLQNIIQKILEALTGAS